MQCGPLLPTELQKGQGVKAYVCKSGATEIRAQCLYKARVPGVEQWLHVCFHPFLISKMYTQIAMAQDVSLIRLNHCHWNVKCLGLVQPIRLHAAILFMNPYTSY